MQPLLDGDEIAISDVRVIQTSTYLKAFFMTPVIARLSLQNRIVGFILTIHVGTLKQLCKIQKVAYVI